MAMVEVVQCHGMVVPCPTWSVLGQKGTQARLILMEGTQSSSEGVKTQA